MNCSEGFIKCNDEKQCVNKILICDGSSDWGSCKDGSDEAHCGDWDCPRGRWKCKIFPFY